ncbi:MAG TPA: MarP family serine protease [Pseudonocardiaceae bacterium]
MNWVDLLVVLLAIPAAVSGARQGMVIALPAFVGLLAGAVVAVWIGPVLIQNITNLAFRVLFAVGIFLLLIILGEAVGVAIGRSIKRRIRNRQLAGLDNALGAVVQGVAVLVVAWMIALPLTSYSGLPGLQAALQNSSVLSAVNKVMPEQARDLDNGLRQLFEIPDLPSVISPFTQTPINEVSPPNSALQNSTIVRDLMPSVVKVRGQAPSCSRSLEGSGFVVASHRVLTNAHVVAGTDRVVIEVGLAELPAKVVYYNPDVDVAELDVPELTAPALELNATPVSTGSDAIVLGYPLDGPYTASAARIRSDMTLTGPNIYDDATVNRNVYELYAQVRSGNSGGPLVNTNGQVIGVIFGAAVGNSDTGFALTTRLVERTLPSNFSSLTQSVSTETCAA